MCFQTTKTRNTNRKWFFVKFLPVQRAMSFSILGSTILELTDFVTKTWKNGNLVINYSILFNL